MQAVDPRHDPPQPRRQRVVAGGPQLHPLEPVDRAQLDQRAAGEQAQVRAAVLVLLAAQRVERVARR